jgi:dCMP deaminase
VHPNKLKWADFYLGLAFSISAKSPDENTQNGCIITDNLHRPLGFGYNGYPRGFDDENLPKTRPAKYNWTIHAEKNCMHNCHSQPVDSGIAYVTSYPCPSCTINMYQFGIRVIWVAHQPSSMFTDEMFDWLLEFITESHVSSRGPLSVIPVIPKLEWLENKIVQTKCLNFNKEEFEHRQGLLIEKQKLLLDS